MNLNFIVVIVIITFSGLQKTWWTHGCFSLEVAVTKMSMLLTVQFLGNVVETWAAHSMQSSESDVFRRDVPHYVTAENHTEHVTNQNTDWWSACGQLSTEMRILNILSRQRGTDLAYNHIPVSFLFHFTDSHVLFQMMLIATRTSDWRK